MTRPRSPRSSISDDWEEVAETASVRSVSSAPSIVDNDDEDLLQFSDSELPSPKRPAKSPAPVSAPAQVAPAPIPPPRVPVSSSTRQDTTAPPTSYKSPSVEDEPEDGPNVFSLKEIRQTVDTLRQDEPSSPIPIRPKKIIERAVEPPILQHDVPSSSLENPFKDPTPEDSFKSPTPDDRPPRANYSSFLDLEDRLGQRLTVRDQSPQDTYNPPPSPPVDAEVYDCTRDPNHYYFTIKDMSENLFETQDLAREMGSRHISTVQLVRTTCQELAELVQQLEPIYASYANYVARGAKSGLSGLPLNPSLLSWMESTTRLLSQTKDQVDMLRPGLTNQDSIHKWPVDASNIPFPVNCAMGNIGRGLQNALSTLKEFFPIIEADYNEFQTEKMKFPSYPAHQDAPAGRAYVSPDVAHRRRELYSLKDQLQAILLFLTEFRNASAETRESVPDATKAIRDLVELIEAVTVILTNNGSEWLDSDMGLASKRVISHRDYLSLDPEVLRGITEHLEDFHNQVDVASEPLFRKYSPTVIQNHQIAILSEGGQMYNLLTTLNLLEAMFIVQD